MAQRMWKFRDNFQKKWHIVFFFIPILTNIPKKYIPSLKSFEISNRYRKMSRHNILLYYLLLFIIFQLNSCAVNHGPVYKKDGRKYGVVSGNFTDRWYDYYERGLSYLAGEYYTEALSDLHTAIEKRPADKRWVNTYGMHFIDYFPHREKGIIHYFMMDLDSAETELMLSIHQEPSAKAKYFLDKVRTKKLQLQKTEITIPELDLTYPKISREDSIMITGTAKDDSYVSDISLSGKKILIQSSDKSIAFTKQLQLPEGENEFEISAKNLLGGMKRKNIRIHVDRSGPIIVITTYKPGVILKGFLRDQTKIKSFILDGNKENIPLHKNSFSIPMNSDTQALTLIASDILGNITRLTVNTKEQNEKKPVASQIRGQFVASNSYTMASDVSSGLNVSPVECPDITIDGSTKEWVAYQQNVNIRGNIRSKHEVLLLSINIQTPAGVYFFRKDISSSCKKGTIVSFNQSIPLKRGLNILTIISEDRLGRESRKQLRIHRDISEIYQLKNRFALKIYPFDEKVDKYEKGFIFGFLGQLPVFKGYARFMDRESRYCFLNYVTLDMKKKERFQVLLPLDVKQNSDVNIKQELVNAKKSIAPDALFLGNTCVDRMGTEITARIIDLKTCGEIVSQDVFGKDSTREGLKRMAEELSEKIHMALPLVTGRIVDSTDTELYVQLKDKKIKKHWPVIVFRDDRENNDTYMSEETDAKIIGYYRMGENNIIHTGKKDHHVKKGDRVINK